MTLSKIHAEGADYYLCCTVRDGRTGFHLVLTNCKDVWCGSVSEEDLKRMSRKLRIPLDSFVQDAESALTRADAGALSFEYSVKQDSAGDVVFCWKKFVPADNVRIQLGSVTLRGDDNAPEVLQSVLDRAIESASAVNESVKSLRSDNERLSAERTTALKRLDKAVTAKEEMETDLYSKFVTVVNDKKRKIRELRDEIEELKSGVPSTSNHSEATVTARIKESPTVKEEALDSAGESDSKSHQDSSDYNTDDEHVSKAGGSRVPAKKMKAADISTDGDLAFEGAEEMSPVVTTATRRRRGRKDLKQTPSKPVIPKVPSSESKKTPTASGRPSVGRKGSSKRSTGSDPDFDDLLNAGFD